MARPREIWSIGIYTGDSPETLEPAPGAANPVLTAADVTDARCLFVADPFMMRERGVWHLFFEIANRDSGKGEIALATSEDGLDWRYRRVVLAEPYHLSYPCVFVWQGEAYMIPESISAGAVVLYRATAFPYTWRRVASLVQGAHADPTPFRRDGRWWLFTCPRPYHHDALALYGSERLDGGWREHPVSPLVVRDASIARPAGRIEPASGRLWRVAQDCRRRYGRRVRAAEIKALTPTRYEESFGDWTPLLDPGSEAWNRDGMHHVDAHRLSAGRWLACVDGHRVEVV